MANRRPIRKFRKRFYGLGKKRPFRWLSSTVEDFEDDGYFSTVIPREDSDPVPPMVNLLDGAQDVQPWADDQEVTIDRIVGSIGINGTIGRTTGVVARPQGLIRLGIIVSEDIDVSSDPTRFLFQDEDLEGAEWMWLHQLVIATKETYNISTPVYWQVNENIPVDIRVRRKIGPRDRLYLYGSYMPDSAIGQFDENIIWAVHAAEMLRVGVMSR